MCTVSFISRNNRYIITSNRDEHTSRPTSFEPKEELVNGCKVVYPKDPKAGGTWFAINENGTVGVLLNGAFEKHISKGGYARSRGLILLDIISSDAPGKHLEKIDLDNIEPFTLVLFEHNTLLQFRWDGKEKHRKPLNIDEDHIWSSATLYSQEIRAHRESLFRTFLGSSDTVDAAAIVDFHSSNNDDYENGFIIDRSTGLKTFSVTQAVIEKNEIALDHFDLLQDKKHSIVLSPNHLLDQLQ
ncbi:NRDE family protein [Spongiimicrobium salis]|uniref:NRDE family protein n=1 Tax=Spongiimicrobium salis TaxID=1667022 RepID=UPI00374DCB0B